MRRDKLRDRSTGCQKKLGFLQRRGSNLAQKNQKEREIRGKKKQFLGVEYKDERKRDRVPDHMVCKLSITNTVREEARRRGDDNNS